MKNRLNISALAALVAWLLAAGCERSGGLTFSSETDDPFYRQGQQLSKQGRNQEALRTRAALVPLNRAGEPGDVASMIAYLLSPRAGYITGECISISGGDWL